MPDGTSIIVQAVRGWTEQMATQAEDVRSASAATAHAPPARGGEDGGQRAPEQPPEQQQRLPTIDEEEERDSDVIVGLDMENAYGRASRSSCLGGVVDKAPALAPILAAQWRWCGTTVWQRVDGAWRRGTSRRGGWQGSRLMQNAYCCGIESSMQRALPRGPLRIGYQDDYYVVGRARAIVDGWEKWGGLCLLTDTG